MSKTTENSHGTAKKLYTGAVISAVATGLIGSIAQVQASEVKQPLPTDAKNEPALVEKEAPKKVEVKTPTKEEVAELGATAKQTQEDADKAKEALDQANETSDKAEKKVESLKQAKDDAQKIADKVTPEVIQGAEKKVETAKAKVPTAEQGVSSAQTAQDDADRNVAIQGKTVGTKQAEVTQAQTGVADAKTTVKNAEDALKGVGLADAKAKQDAAIKEEATSKQAQTDAQIALDAAKKLDGELADQLKKAETTVKTATQDVERTENEAKEAKANLDQATVTYNQAVSTLDALQDSSKKQTITLSPAFIQAVKDKIAFLRQIDEGVEMTEEERNAKSDEIYDRIVGSQVEHKNFNKYVPTKADLADKTRYDINNLPQEIKDELNYYVVDLINQMRRQLGLSDVVLSKTSLEFADKVAKEYVKANFSHAMEEDYHARGGVGHYAIGINKVAKEYGMPTTDAEEESKGEQYYENTVTTKLKVYVQLT